MKTNSHSFVKEHNAGQKSYFENTYKKTMQPRDTPYVNRHVDELFRFAKIRPGDRVLEVGCGIGRYTFPLVRRGVKVEGVDLASGLLDQLHEIDGGEFDIPLHCADIINFSLPEGEAYKALIGFFTLHHFHDLDLCYKAMADLMIPGTIIAFVEPNAFNPLYYLQMLFTPGMTWEGDGGIVNMRKRRIFKAMEKAGLVKLKVIRYGFFPPFLRNRSWGAKWESWLERFPPFYPFLPFQIFMGQKPLDENSGD